MRSFFSACFKWHIKETSANSQFEQVSFPPSPPKRRVFQAVLAPDLGFFSTPWALELPRFRHSFRCPRWSLVGWSVVAGFHGSFMVNLSLVCCCFSVVFGSICWISFSIIYLFAFVSLLLMFRDFGICSLAMGLTCF